MTGRIQKSPDKKKGGSGVGVEVVSYVLIFAPAAAGFLYVYLFGVNIPFGDAWTMVPRFDSLSLGTLGFRDLWVQHYEHRIFFVRVALLLVGAATEFNQLAAMYLTQILLLVTLLILLAAFKSSVNAKVILFAPVAFLLFSWKQWFNMLHAMQVAFVLTLMCGVLAFYLLYVSTRGGFKKLAFIGALGSGVAATFSFSAGVLVWPIGFLQLLISPVEKAAKLFLVGAWCLVGLGSGIVYSIGFRTMSSERQGTLYNFDSPDLLVGFSLASLGGSLFWSVDPALAGGLIVSGLVLVALIFAYRDGKLSENSFWIALILFALLCTVSLTLGRSGKGIANALESRYTTFTTLAVIGVYAMLLKAALERGGRVAKASFGALLAVVMLSTLASYPVFFSEGAQKESQYTRAASALSTYSRQPDPALNIVNRSADVVRREAFVLCKLGYSVFSDPRAQARNCLPPPLPSLSPVGPPADSSDFSEIETVSGIGVDGDQPIVVTRARVERLSAAGEPSIRVSGWAVDAFSGGASGGVYIEVDGEPFPAFHGRSQADQRGGILTGAPLVFSGFERDIPLSEIGPGRHELSVVVVTSDRERYYEPNEEVVIDIRSGGEE